MRDPDVVIIGGGQSGLVMSRSLAAHGIDHIVLERGRIGERWHSERWHSLRLLTTNEFSALPGLPHKGEPEAFMPARAFAEYLDTYAQAMATPVITGVEVKEVKPTGAGYSISTSAGHWKTRAVIVATGPCDIPYRPAMAEALAPSIVQMFPAHYREPGQLPEGGVLVVGASSTGVQLAEEIHASGRQVTIAVGDHTRVPRRYRGRDIYAWMDAVGILNDRAFEGGNLDAARRQPSLQLVGRSDNRDLHLGILRDQGIRVVGRLAAIGGTKVAFSGDLERTTAASHSRMLRTLERIDDGIIAQGLEASAADPGVRTAILAAGDLLTLDSPSGGIRSIVWATGYIRRYPWLKARVLDARGEIIHRGGVTASPGLYVLGLTFMRRRRSSLIDGCGLDADDLAPMVKGHLDLSVRQVA